MLRNVKRSVEIKRLDSSRKVVYGEVMIPAPDMAPGDHVTMASLEGRIHFDGAFMVEADIVELADRFATKRPSTDVEHNGIPVATTAVESFIARAGDTDYLPGSWVVGLKVHDSNVWERVERGELRAFSIQFVVRVEEIPVKIILDDGAVREETLFRFTNGDPQFLSLVHRPATGALWKRVDRSLDMIDATRSRWSMFTRTVVPFADLPIADVAEFDAVAARGRIFGMTDGFDPEKVRAAFVYYDPESADEPASYQLPIADVVDGELVVSLHAVAAAVAELDPEKDADALAVLEQYRVKSEATPEVFAGMVEEEMEKARAANAAAEGEGAAAEGDPAEAQRSMGAKIIGLVRRAFGMQADPEDLTADGRQHVTREIQDDPNKIAEAARADLFADYLADGAGTLVAGMEALLVTFSETVNDAEDDDEAADKLRQALADFAQWGVNSLNEGTVDAFTEGIPSPTEGDAPGGDGDEGAAAEAGRSEEVRGAFASSIQAADIGDKVWRATDTLMGVLFGIMRDEEITDKGGQMKLAVAEFATYMSGVIDSASEDLTALRFEPDETEEVARAGRKIKGKRLKELKAILSGLEKLIGELDDEPEQTEVSESRGEGAPAEGGDVATEEPAQTEAARSEGVGAAAAEDTPTIPDPDALLKAFEGVVAVNKGLEERIRSLETARPPASAAGGAAPPTATTPYDKVATLLPVFFPGQQS